LTRCFTYSYREAVIDGYLIDHESPVRIETALSRAGIEFNADPSPPSMPTPDAWCGRV
jgi:type I site-specific restriction endonuclease